MPLVPRLLARALNMTPRRVHLSTGFVVILSIASTSLLICVVVLRSPGVPMGTHLSYKLSDTDIEIPVPINYTSSVESVFDESDSIKRHNPVESRKESDVKTTAQLMESSLPPPASQAHKQEERSTSTGSADLRSSTSEENHSIRSSSAGAVDAWWRSLQANRTARVRELCVALTPARDTDLFRECGLRLDGIFVDRSNRILYCAIPKVASSSVKLAMTLMTGRGGGGSASSSYPPPVHSNGWLRSVGIYSLDYLVDSDPRWLRSAWSSLRKFVVVRHPVERLVSAYVDKFTLRNRFSDYFRRRYGRKIVRLYRNMNASESLRPREEFAAEAAAAAGSDVSFREFVQFVVDQRIPCAQKYNAHWMSYYDVCHPCLVDYDFVVRFERLADEMRPLWRALYNRSDVDGDDDVLPRRNAGKRRTSDLVGHYVGQLRSDHISALYYAYERDFRLFVYSL